jgi:uncharacterized protein (DUF1501 family)
MLCRRELMKRCSLIALAPTVPGFLARLARAADAKADDRILVVVQLDGGNDGLNTVVPYGDEGYAKQRDKLRLVAKDLLKLNDEVALHPAMRAAAELFESQRLTIVEGVGYPNPNRSHDVSMAIWHTARFDPADHKSYGWLGRALDTKITSASDRASPALLRVGDGALPTAVIGRRAVAGGFSRLDELTASGDIGQRLAADIKPVDATPSDVDATDDLADFARRATLDAYATADSVSRAAAKTAGQGYPSTALGQHLGTIARLIEAQLPTRVYYAAQSGYDTHAVQLPRQATLLRELSGALKAFLDDLAASHLADRVMVLCFSEFGRRVAENGSAGTDHGTAGPVFLAGGGARAGLVGQRPSLADLDQGDFKMTVDFRRVYATLLDDWLGIDSQAVLGERFERIKI